MMVQSVSTIIQPFINRGLFESPEKAVTEMARHYTLHQIEQYQAILNRLQNKYGMTYEQFESYLEARSTILVSKPNPQLNQAIMQEEEDAFDWKVASEMLNSWLGLQYEV